MGYYRGSFILYISMFNRILGVAVVFITFSTHTQKMLLCDTHIVLYIVQYVTVQYVEHMSAIPQF